MSTVEHIEYYATCPSCGATNDGDVCSYCGTSMIKGRTIVEAPERDIARRNAEEDAALPVVKGRSAEVSSFLKAFCPIFGGCFMLVPIILLVAFGAAGILEPFMAFFLVPFFLIGVAGIMPLVLRVIHRSKCHRGVRMQAIVRGYQDSSVLVNGKPVRVMRLRINVGGQLRLLLLSSEETEDIYPVGSTIYLRNWKNHYLVEE